MKTRLFQTSRYQGRPHTTSIGGFTLVELIGVLAIISVLSAIIAPNVLRSIERAAVKAERESAERIGRQLELYLSDQGVLPTSANWTDQIAQYSEMSPAELATNKRQNPRQMIFDASTNRAMVLSSMRSGLIVPTSGNINNASRFDEIWQTADGSIPPVSSWSGWSAWSAVANSSDYLVIERINLLPIYKTDLKNYTVTLNNTGATVASYSIVFANGSSQSATNIAGGSSVVLSGMRSRDRISLYDVPGGGSLAYSYVISDSGKTFDFDGVDWLPQ